MQLEYTEEKDRLVAGAFTRGTDHRRVRTLVNTLAGRPQIRTIVFAGVWAPADTVTSTLAGVEVETTLAAGEDTPAEARDAHLSDLQADATLSEFFEFTSTSTDTITVTSKEVADDTGAYYSLPGTTVETTAGNGTATMSEAQTRQNRGDMKFGLGVVKVLGDATGKLASLPEGTGGLFAGVTVFSHSYGQSGRLQGDDGIEANDAFNGAIVGSIAVRIDSDVAASIAGGGPLACFLKHTQDANGTPGQFRNTNTNADAVPATFTGVVEGNLAEIILNAP